MADDLPDYEPMLDAYHRAFAAELRSMIAVLPIGPGMKVLDVASGDGAYASWLAERVGPSGLVVAEDVDPRYVELVSRRTADAPGAPILPVVAGLEHLPFPRGHFDLAWCAQSFFSLPDPAAATRRMVEAVRPGGVVAVLEDDTLHRVLLPWPVELELAVRVAERDALAEESANHPKFYVGRRLRPILEEAGLVDVQKRTFATDRHAPMDEDVKIYLRGYLAEIAERVRPRLKGRLRADFEALVDESGPSALLNWPDLSITLLDHLVWGTKPPA